MAVSAIDGPSLLALPAAPADHGLRLRSLRLLRPSSPSLPCTGSNIRSTQSPPSSASGSRSPVSASTAAVFSPSLAFALRHRCRHDLHPCLWGVPALVVPPRLPPYAICRRSPPTPFHPSSLSRAQPPFWVRASAAAVPSSFPLDSCLMPFAAVPTPPAPRSVSASAMRYALALPSGSRSPCPTPLACHPTPPWPPRPTARAFPSPPPPDRCRCSHASSRAF